MKFTNKVVVVTGAAGGIGTEITKRFINEGAKVVAVDISAEAMKYSQPEELIDSQVSLN